ncbi:hypothetical protein [Niveispirillum sp.]|uniref:hypothetical protein n=1 Tax=Niveispirillum sp. TaxID=1917217 RepID=UPI001B687E09|nr:hypothetical protein [Niveispirillum sp.]MBP7340591.1 hypothetical protein [Niveispirillum sp.]
MVETLSIGANIFLIVAAIQLDAPSGLRLDWRTRPITPVTLLVGKLGFLTASLLLPSMVADLLHDVIAGVGPGALLPRLLDDHGRAVIMALPIIAMAALTTRLLDAGVLGLAVAVLNAIVLSVMLTLAGQSPDQLDEQVLWPMVPVLAAIVAVGSILVLWLHYVPRREGAARLAFGITALLAAATQAGFILTL